MSAGKTCSMESFARPIKNIHKFPLYYKISSQLCPNALCSNALYMTQNPSEMGSNLYNDS